MLSTMQDFPLTISAILRYATTVHGDRIVSTATGGGAYREASYTEIGKLVSEVIAKVPDAQVLADLDATAAAGDALRDAIRRDWMLEGPHLSDWVHAWLPG